MNNRTSTVNATHYQAVLSVAESLGEYRATGFSVMSQAAVAREIQGWPSEDAARAVSLDSAPFWVVGDCATEPLKPLQGWEDVRELFNAESPLESNVLMESLTGVKQLVEHGANYREVLGFARELADDPIFASKGGVLEYLEGLVAAERLDTRLPLSESKATTRARL